MAFALPPQMVAASGLAALGATRCLGKPFKPTTVLSVIHECLTEAEPHRGQVATLSAVADSLSELQPKLSGSDPGMEVPHQLRRFGGKLL